MQKFKKILCCVALFLFKANIFFAQIIGNRVSVLAADGKTYTGEIKNIYNNQYQIKYDGYETLYWLQASQFTLLNNGNTQNNLSGIAQTPTSGNTKTDVQWLQSIYEFGYQKGWSSPLYTTKYNNYINSLSAKNQHDLLVFLRQAKTSSARFFALKSLITGDSYEVIQQFITQLNEYSETYQQEKCLVTGGNSIIQQWQFSCSISMLQTFLADLSPRYAWDVKHVPSFNVVANDPNCAVALQQKQLLEKYGGVASPRGDVTGTSIGIINPLRELVTPILGVNFYAQEATEPLANIFAKMRLQLDKGINMPLLIDLGSAASRHFVLAMRYKNSYAGYQYLIYDPWEGKCDYVSESTIMRGSLSPLLAQWNIHIAYYYPVD